MAEHNCSKSEVIDMIVTGQEKIFDKLDVMTGLLEGVALQKLEIGYLQKDVADIKTENSRRDSRLDDLERQHISRPQTVAEKAVGAAIVAVAASSAVAVFWFFAYVVYINLPGYVGDLQKEQHREIKK